MRFGVKLRLSVRAVVGSASEWEICERRYNKCSNTIQYNTAHCIQLRILEGFKAADVSPLIGKCRHLVGHFKHSSANTTELKTSHDSISKEEGATFHKLLQHVPTRWNSTYLMLMRLLEVKDAIIITVPYYPSKKLQWSKAA